MARYSDINFRFGLNNKPILLEDAEAIKAAIQKLVLTRPGERLFLPTFGSRVPTLLWESINDNTAISIFNAVADAINIWEPRAEFDAERSYVTPEPENNAYQIGIAFRIRQTQAPTNLVFRVFGEGG